MEEKQLIKKTLNSKIAVVVLIVILTILLLISVGFNIYFCVESKYLNTKVKYEIQEIINESGLEVELSELTLEQINQEEIKSTVTMSITEKNGVFTGTRVDGKKTGSGIYKWNDGTVYEGEFEDDKMHGKGKLTTVKNGTYEGEFKNGRKTGTGTYTFANGDIYTGNWENDKMSGEGTYTFKNGDKYVGNFSDNKFNGTGTYTTGGNSYKGTWKDNEYSTK